MGSQAIRNLNANAEKFYVWMEANPRQMELFEELALRRAEKGKLFSGQALLEHYRRENLDLRPGLVHTGGEYEFNQNHAPYLSRELIVRHPHLVEFMELRRCKGEVNPEVTVKPALVDNLIDGTARFEAAP